MKRNNLEEANNLSDSIKGLESKIQKLKKQLEYIEKCERSKININSNRCHFQIWVETVGDVQINDFPFSIKQLIQLAIPVLEKQIIDLETKLETL